MTFILAANGKATANVLMYPFKLAKARAQVESSDNAKSSGSTPAEKTHPMRMPKNPISAVAHIARTEGVPALYAGVWGELMKGFFSHGLTMLIKEEIPNFAIRMLLLLSSLRRRYRKMKL